MSAGLTPVMRWVSLVHLEAPALAIIVVVRSIVLVQSLLLADALRHKDLLPKLQWATNTVHHAYDFLKDKVRLHLAIG